MTPNKWAIQRVFSIKLFDLVTGENIGLLEELKQSNFTNDGTIVWADGGQGNPHIVPFDHSKRSTLSCQSATFSNDVFGAQVGATPVTGINTNLVITDILTVTNNATTTTYTALGATGAEIKYAYLRNADGSLGTKYVQDATVSVGKFTYTPGTKTLTFNTGEISDNSQIVVFYNATAGASTKTITSKADIFSKSCKMVADGIVRNVYDDKDYAAQIIYYKGKISNKFDFALTADGNPAVQNFEIEAAKQPGTTTLWDMIIYDNTEIS